jgi:hypothetical protein
MYMSVFGILGWFLRLGVTIALLASIHPALILLTLFALPTVFTSVWRPSIEREAQERGAQAARLSRHLFATATTATSAKEVRVLGIGDRLLRDRREAWERWYRGVSMRDRRPPSGTRWRGQSSAPPMSAPSCLWRRATRNRATSSWCSPPAHACLRTLGRRSARSASCAASGWTDRAAWRGSRITPRRSSQRLIYRFPPRCSEVSVSTTSRFLILARRA